MATFQENVEAAVAGAVSGTAGETDAVKTAAVAAATAAIPAPPPQDVGWLWKMLVGGLLFVMVLSLGGIVWSVMDGEKTTSSDVLVTIFTATLTALMGLFVKSPTE